MIEELTKAKTLVEKNNNDKSIFIFNTTQQIRQPLNMIEQKTEQLLESGLKEETLEKVMDIRTSQQRISYILRGVMDLSTIDAKKIKTVDSKYKITNLLREITLKSKQQAQEKELEFRTSFEESIPEVLYGDSIRLKQVINALISNAIKYTKEGFVELDVSAIISFDVCRLVISVKDSGIGVNAEEINKLFQAKEDGELLDKVDESDLTLETAKKVVNLIGGTITVRSEKHRGSEFTLIIDQKIDNENHKIATIINEYKSQNNKKKVMVVTDSEEQRNLFLKRSTQVFDIVVSKNGEEFLKRIRNKEKYDLVIIKENMEKLDAYQMIKKLNKMGKDDLNIVLLVDTLVSRNIKNGYKTVSKDVTSKIIEKLLK